MWKNGDARASAFIAFGVTLGYVIHRAIRVTASSWTVRVHWISCNAKNGKRKTDNGRQVLFLFFQMFHIQFRLGDDDAGEGDEGDEVRDGHERVYDVGQDPDGFQFQETARCDEADEDDAVWQDDFDAAQIFRAAFAVIVPAEDRRESEENKGNHEEVAAESREGVREGCVRQGRAIEAARPFAGDDEGEPGQGADDDRVDEGACHGDEALLGRPFCLGRRCCDRSRAEAGFIREDAARHPVSHRHHDGRAEESARCRRPGEGRLDDKADGARHLVRIGNQDENRDDEINDGHSRHDFGRNGRNRLQPADCDGRDEDRQNERGVNGIEACRDFRDFHDGIDLRKCPDAEEGDEDAGNGKECAERFPFFAHPVFDVVHRAAGNISFGVLLAVFHGEKSFGVFRRHAEESGHPHPENGAGAAGCDGSGDADDIARADGGGERRAECFETVDIAVAVIFRRENEMKGARQLRHL